MTDAVQFVIPDQKGFRRAMRRAPELLAKNTGSGLNQAMFRARREFIDLQRSKGRRKIGGRFFYEVDRSSKAESVSARVFTESAAAKVLEEGAVISGKGGAGYLAIPIGHALTSTGRRKKRYANVGAAFDRLEGGGYAWIETGRGAIVFERRGRRTERSRLVSGERTDEADRRLLPIYFMVKQVRIAASLGFTAFYRERGLKLATERQNAAIAATLRNQKLPRQTSNRGRR